TNFSTYVRRRRNRSQSHEDPFVMGRKIARTACHRVHQCSYIGFNGNFRAARVSVAGRSLEFKTDPRVFWLRNILQQHGRAVKAGKYSVRAPVVIPIADGKPASAVVRLKYLAGPFAHIPERGISVVSKQQGGLFVFYVHARRLYGWVDMAIYDQ